MKKSDLQNRLKSKVFWVSVISAIALILKALGIYEIEDTTISIIVDTVFSVLTIFGIANNPTNKTGF